MRRWRAALGVALAGSWVHIRHCGAAPTQSRATGCRARAARPNPGPRPRRRPRERWLPPRPRRRGTARRRAGARGALAASAAAARGGLLPEAHGVLGVEPSIDNRTVCETEVVARLPALDQYVWRGGQAERPLGGVVSAEGLPTTFA